MKWTPSLKVWAWSWSVKPSSVEAKNIPLKIQSGGKVKIQYLNLIGSHI